MAREGILLGYGNPLLDISVTDKNGILEKYKLKANDAILAEDVHKPMYEEISKNEDVIFIPGGATLNALRVAQWLLQVPHATTFFGCIADDEFGKILKRKALEEGVTVRFQITDKEATGTCAVICKGRDRSLVANLAAANCYTEDHLNKPDNWAFVEKAEYFYCAGFPLTACPKAMLQIAKHAMEKNKLFTMNLSAPFLCSFFKEAMLEILPYIDILFGNELEADEFAKANELNTTDRKDIALKIAALKKENKKRPRIVVITQGDQPTYVAQDGKITEYPATTVKPENFVDANGAGDSFVGGFLSQLVLGKSIDECIRCAHYAGNLNIQHSGCTFPDKPTFV
ncbi:adenosine kinase-like isoform X2 [Gigantopelta aegis]|uniref:adenosine kinase-like isoform X2 n=1 Tax=Gigantopelta aegis TaxID=1735272 RepID=UPI001B88B724|nr:adenosine kinase-like isoform X2 [Gigantopelta aegis]